MPLKLRLAADVTWDCLALGEVMLRFDPGEGRVRTARQFQVWEGGGEYNTARALRKCFGLRAAIATALPDNDLGRLVEDFICQGGVDTSHIIWRASDGLGANTRVGLNFTERGFGIRPPLGCVDRAGSAASQIRPGEFDWDRIFGKKGVRWFHTGGIFAALSPHTADVVLEAVQAARRHGVIVSYDLNYRASLWKSRGGPAAAEALNRRIAPHVDVMIGCLGTIEDTDNKDTTGAMVAMCQEFPNIAIAASTMRTGHSATRNEWWGVAFADGKLVGSVRRDLEIFDRVGGGDGFASGLIFGLLSGKSVAEALEYGAAHGALAMTTPGDNSMASLDEVEAAVRGSTVRVNR